MNVTSSIPIVMSPAGAPLQAGLVKSLARPGGNVTGLSSMEAELGDKRLELLRSGIPRLHRVAILGAKTDPFTSRTFRIFRAPLRAPGFSCSQYCSTARTSVTARLERCVRAEPSQ
jgi:ABC-type uncharacterized transport system substrate-binding protein